MRNNFYRRAAALLAAALIITNNPTTVYSSELRAEDQDVLVDAGEYSSDEPYSDELFSDDLLPEDISSETPADVLTDVSANSAGDILTSKPDAPVPVSSDETGISEPVWDGEIPEEYLNYKDIDVDIEESEIGFYGTGKDRRELMSVTPDRGILPSKYITDYSLLPRIKDQRPFGTCWSFASMASCEVSLAKKFGLSAAALDFSERAFVYFFYDLKGIDDPLKHTLGDYHTPVLGSDHDIYQLGGNVMLGSVFLFNWGMPVDEIAAPYDVLKEIGPTGNLTTDKKKGDDALDDSLCYTSEYHVQDVRFIKKDDVDGIKQAIVDNGIAARSYYHTGAYVRYVSENNTYSYNSGDRYNGRTNHAITIVGWDDDFLSGNFVEKPEKNGAWLIRNSWGENEFDGGYLWISYEDQSLSDVTVITCDDKNNYDKNYFYDGSANVTSSMGEKSIWKAANVYTASDNEVLKAVSIGVKSADVPYSVQIYKNLTDTSDPTSGKAMFATPVTGTTSYPGFYTIPLDTLVPLSKGETFSVVFTLSEEDAEVTSLYVEKSTVYDKSKAWLRVTADINEGQSFFKKEGNGWYDMARSEACFRIHAYTDDGTLTLDRKILEINSAFDDRTDTISVNNSYEREIKEVSLPDTDAFDVSFTKNATDKSGTVKVVYTGEPLERSFDTRIKFVLDNVAEPIYRQIKIDVTNVEPVLKLTTLKKVDHLYAPDSGKGEIMAAVNTGRITDVKLVDADRNGKTKGVLNPLSYEAEAPEISEDGLSALLNVKDIPGRKTGYNKARIDVYIYGYNKPVSKDISISNMRSSLKSSVTGASVLTKDGKALAGSRIEIAINNTKDNKAEPFISPVIKVTGKDGTSLEDRYTASYSDGLVILTPAAGMPLAAKGEKINISVSDTTHAAPFLISDFRVKSVNIVKMVLKLDKTAISAGYYEGEDAINKGLVYSAGLGIKGCFGLNDYIGNGIRIEGTNAKSTKALAEGHLRVIYDKVSGKVMVSFPDGNPPAAGSYRYKLRLPKGYTGLKKDVSTNLSVSVKKLSKVKAESCKAMAKGRFDVLYRDSEVTFKPSFSNLPADYKVSSAELTGDDADRFAVAGCDDTGITRVTLKHGVIYNTRVKYRIGLKYVISVGGGSLTSYTQIKNVSVTQSKVTLTASGVNHFGAVGGKQSEELKVKAYNSIGTELEIKDIILTNPNEEFSLVKQDGRYMIRFIPDTGVERDTLYTLELQVVLEDKAEDAANEICSYDVTVFRQ